MFASGAKKRILGDALVARQSFLYNAKSSIWSNVWGSKKGVSPTAKAIIIEGMNAALRTQGERLMGMLTR